MDRRGEDGSSELIGRAGDIDGDESHGTVEFIAPGGGVSMLDISTRLRITEAELNIVRREVSELLAERNTLEVQFRRHRESWKFSLQQLGRAIEQRNEALINNHHLKSALSVTRTRSPEVKKKKAQLKAELEACRQQLETQTRVSRQLEHERDRAYDDYEFAKAQLATLMLQQQDLMAVCAEVTREKERALTQSQMLKEELNRYDSELHSSVELEGEGAGGKRERILLQQVKLLKEEREHLQLTYQQALEQYKRQLNKANLDRRQAMASTDAMRALLQRRLDASQAEAQELRQELKASDEIVNSLKMELAQVRISLCTQRQETSDDQSAPQVYHHLSQGSAGSSGVTMFSDSLISPSNHHHPIRVSSARSRVAGYVPSASPFPEETHSENTASQTEDSSWI